MIPNRVRRFVEDLVPWYDRDEERRHDERSRYIHDRSVRIRQDAEVRIAAMERIRYAYSHVGTRFDRG